MTKTLQLSALLMVLILSACSSDNEPESEYTGPWQIVYSELYSGWHTSNPKFKDWFDNHLQHFEYAEFSNYSGTEKVLYDKEKGDWIEWQDYETWYNGGIIWYEIVQNATEKEIQAKVAEFESFSSYKDEYNHHIGDDFKSQYKKIE